MAITDYKITDGEITQRNVKSAPDVLSDTPNNNKAVFDNLTEHFIGKYNDLIDNINSDFVDSSEFAEGLTVTDKVRWRYALTKGTSIGLNFSGNITQITTGYRTIVGDIDGLTETDFMDCYLSINGTDYECGDSYASGNSIFTSAVINGVTVEIIYDTTNGNITLEHTTNPLDTLYWNVSIYRSVAEKVPRKALPATISNDGYTELMATGKWHGVNLEKNWETKELTKVSTFALPEDSVHSEYFDKPPIEGTTVVISHTVNTHTYTARITVGDTEEVDLYPFDLSVGFRYLGGVPIAVDFEPNENIESDTYTISYVVEVDRTNNYMPVMDTLNSDTAYLSDFAKLLASHIIVESKTIDTNVAVVSGNTAHRDNAYIAKNGYTAIAVVGQSIEGSTGVYFYRCYINRDAQYAVYYLRNVNQSTATVTVKMDILYIKN